MTRQMLGKSEAPSEAHPMGVTVDGVPIVPGLVVWTNEYRPGTVLAERFPMGNPPEWFDVEYASGGRVMQNPERVAVVFEGKRASDALAADRELSAIPEETRRRRFEA